MTDCQLAIFFFPFPLSFLFRRSTLIIKSLMSGPRLVVKLLQIFHGAFLDNRPHFDEKMLKIMIIMIGLLLSDVIVLKY